MNNCSLLPIIIAFIFVASLPSSYSTEKYQDVGLEVHNKYRVHHKVPPLTLNENVRQFMMETYIIEVVFTFSLHLTSQLTFPVK